MGKTGTGGRGANPVFKEIMLKAQGEKLVGGVPELQPEIERSIAMYLNPGPVETAVAADTSFARIFE
jgi:hypothetical protein